MNKTTVFSKTGKGLLEIKNKSNRLSKDQFRVLNLVDGKATLDDLVEKSRITEVELRKVLAALSDGGFIKEFTNPGSNADYTSITIPPVPPSTSYVDDLDFTQILGPAKPAKSVYQSAQTEQKQREETDRKASEAAAAKAREESDRRAKEEAARRSHEEEAARRIRDEAERKAKEEQSRREKLEAEMRSRLDEPRRLKEEAERKAREKAETEKRVKEEAERRVREEAERRAKIQAEAAARVEAERKRLQDEERKRQEDEERRRREEEQREEEERKRKEEEERKRKEEEERQRREEEERKRREEEERKRKEEEESKRREEEERKRREEEERKRREEEERKRKEEEERKRREEEERKRKEEEERKRREEEERKRKEEEERKRREEEERKRKEEEARKEEERRRREEEERKRREEEERKQRKEEERKRLEDEERRRKEEEERKRKEEEERKRKEEAERLRRELEERHRREEAELLRRLESGDLGEEQARLEREEQERRQQEEDRRGREEEKQRRRDEEEEQRRRGEERRRREDDERKRREDDERKRREDDERKRRAEEERESSSAFPSLDMTALSAPASSTPPPPSNPRDADMTALRRAEAEVEKEFMAKEAAIRKALEEQERRFRLEDEARTALDRAEREARDKADREARELAEAAERARREAEQRAREESVRRQQEDKEKRAQDQEERKKKSEEERKKRERERREQEQRAREEALAKKRKDQEELDRKKSERERLARDAQKMSWGPGRIAVVVLAVLVALVVGGIQVAPLSAYAPQMEKLASETIGEPVRIGGVHASVFPSFHIKLENVTVGAQQDVRAPSVTAYMDFGSVFGDDKVIRTLQIEQLQTTQEALVRMAGWLSGGAAKERKIKLQKIVFKGAKLDVKGVAVPVVDADLLLGPDASLLRASVETTDGHFQAEVLPKGAEADVTARIKNLTLPLGPSLELVEGQAKGVLQGNQIRISELDLYLYSGQSKGQAVLSWGPTWSLEGDFDLKRVALEPAMKGLKIDIASDGMLDAKGRYAMQSNSLETLFDNLRLESNFTVQKGSLSGLDLVRALQSPTRDGIQGGKTKFDELTGALSVAGTRYSYNNVRLNAGLLTASGAGEVTPNKDVNGRVYVELRSSSNVVKGTFRVTGDLKAIVIKP